MQHHTRGGDHDGVDEQAVGRIEIAQLPSARVLEAVGFQALATTSSGFAFTLGLTTAVNGQNNRRIPKNMGVLTVKTAPVARTYTLVGKDHQTEGSFSNSWANFSLQLLPSGALRGIAGWLVVVGLLYLFRRELPVTDCDLFGNPHTDHRGQVARFVVR